MKVNKLKLAALAMSAITCVTSVPNVAFAEEFAAAFTSDATAEDIFVSDGSAVGEGDGFFAAEETAVAADSFDVFLFDDGAAGEIQEGIVLNVTESIVHFCYKEDDYQDYTVLYFLSGSDGNFYDADGDVVTGVDSDDETEWKKENNDPAKPYVCETLATREDLKITNCEEGQPFKLSITIPSTSVYTGIGPVTSEVFNDTTTVNAHTLEIVEDSIEVVTPPTCTESGSNKVTYVCSVCGYTETVEVDVPELGHDFSGDPEKAYVTDNVKVNEDGSVVFENGKPVVIDPTKVAQYGESTVIFCSRDCGEFEVVEEGDLQTIPSSLPLIYKVELDPVAKSNIVAEDNEELVTADEQQFFAYESELKWATEPDEEENVVGVVGTAAQEPSPRPENDDIRLANCKKDGYYFIRAYDGDDKLLYEEKVTVKAHHIEGYYVITLGNKAVKVTVEDGEVTLGEVEGKEQITELNVTADKDGNLKITSNTCLAYDYTITTYCDVCGEAYGDPVKGNAPSSGAHSLDTDANAIRLDFIEKWNKVYTFKDIKDKIGDNKYIKIVYPEGVDCEKITAVDVEFTCQVCEKTIDNWTVEMTLSEPKKHTEPVVSNPEYVPATCSAEGYFTTVWTCEDCGKVLRDSVTTIPKLPHTYVADSKGDYSNVKVNYDGNIVIDSLSSLLKKFNTEGEFPVDPTEVKAEEEDEEDTKAWYVGNYEDEKGVKVSLCEVCAVCGGGEKEYTNDDFEVKVTKVDKDSSKSKYCQEGRIYLTSSLTVDGKVVVSDDEDFAYYATSLDFAGRTPHKEGNPKREDEVTNEDGSVDYNSVVYCELCRAKLYSNPGHDDGEPKPDPIHHEAQEADCKTGTPGNKEYWEYDGKFYSDEACTTAVTEEWFVIPVTHKTELKEEVAATCVKDGKKAHYVCSVCEKLFEDEEGTKEVTEEDLVIAATGEHKAAAPVMENFVEAQPFTSGSYDSVVYCEVCNEEISRETTSIPALRKPYAIAVLGLHSNIYPETETARIYFTAQDGVDDYRINYRIAGTGSAGYDAVDGGRVRTGGSNDYVVSGLKKGALYDFRVAAGNYVDGDENDVVWGTRSGYNRRWMQTVETVNIKAGTGNITVQWVEPTSATPSKYVVYYSPNKDMSGQKSVTVKGGTNTVTISGLEKGTRYYVRIRPYAQESKKTYSGSLSNRVSAKVK